MSDFSIVFGILELKLHGNLFESRVIFDLDSLDKLKLIHSFINCVQILFSFEDEDLIRFIFIHDQLFTTYESQYLLIRGNLHRNNFIWLS